MGKSSIEWTGSTWNPIRAKNRQTGQVGTWCQKISPGCAHCYAATHNARCLPHGSSGLPYTAQGGELAEIFLDSKILAEPLRRKKPETYFVCSMTDLFGEFVPFEMIAAVWGVMAACPQHMFQLLTKRPERAREFFGRIWGLETTYQTVLRMAEYRGGVVWDSRGSQSHLYYPGASPASLKNRRPAPAWPLANVWLGTSVESQEYADKRVPALQACPAAIRFFSCEPLLGPIDLEQAGAILRGVDEGSNGELGEFAIGLIDWVIVGGESGHGARPMHPQWARSLRDQCQETDVAYFFKQWGEWQLGSDRGNRLSEIVLADGRHGKTPQDLGWSLYPSMDQSRHWHDLGPTIMARVGKKDAGRKLDGREWNEMPVLSREGGAQEVEG
jgi:protein gp37